MPESPSACLARWQAARERRGVALPGQAVTVRGAAGAWSRLLPVIEKMVKGA